MAEMVSDEDHEQRLNVKETWLKWTEKMNEDLLDCKRKVKRNGCFRQSTD